MLAIKILLLCALYASARSSESDEPVLYYYGLEENERSLPVCESQQACSAVLQRYWQPPALVRLCRCGRRQRCDEPAPSDRLLELNNRAHMQFCLPTLDWPQCSINDAPLTVVTSYDRMNPDDLENQHHEDIEMIPPKITVKCKCRSPNYWKLNSTDDNVQIYQCASMPVCSTGEFCGNVRYDLNALHQSCLCPKHHICVHGGGVTHIQITELLYKGRGWKAYCQRIENDSDYDYSDED